MKKMWSYCFSILVMGLLVSGCATKSSMAPAGFLGDYSRLKPSTVIEGLYVDKDMGIDMAQYDKFIVDPVIIYISSDANGSGIDPVKLKELSDFFRDEIIMALSENYSVVDNPGPNVLRIRTAITDVVPNKVAFNLHWSTTMAGYGLGGAAVEADFLDSQTNQRVMAVKDARTGKRYHYTKGLTKWGHTKNILTKWAKMFSDHMDRVHQKN